LAAEDRASYRRYGFARTSCPVQRGTAAPYGGEVNTDTNRNCKHSSQSDAVHRRCLADRGVPPSCHKTWKLVQHQRRSGRQAFSAAGRALRHTPVSLRALPLPCAATDKTFGQVSSSALRFSFRLMCDQPRGISVAQPTNQTNQEQCSVVKA